MSTKNGAAPPMNVAQIRAHLERLDQARRAAHVPALESEIPEYCQRVAKLWAVEAEAWGHLGSAPDFPLGTDSGVLLAKAAELAALLTEMRALSWSKSGETGRPPREPS